MSRRFTYDHPELRAAIDLKAAEAVARFSGRLAATAQVTGASLGADLAAATPGFEHGKVAGVGLDAGRDAEMGELIRVAVVVGSGGCLSAVQTDERSTRPVRAAARTSSARVWTPSLRNRWAR